MNPAPRPVSFGQDHPLDHHAYLQAGGHFSFEGRPLVPSKRQVSMTLSPAADRAVTRRVNIKNRNRSRIVSQMIERYLGVMRAHHLELSEDELEHLLRLTEGWTLDLTTAAALEGLVMVADVPEDLSVSRGRLLASLQIAGIAGAVSAIEQLEQKWGR